MMPKLLSSSSILSLFILLGFFTRQSYASAPLTPGIVECQLEGIRILVSDIQAVLVHSPNDMKALLQKPAVKAVIEKACDDYAQCELQASSYRAELADMMVDVRKQLKDFSFSKSTGICKDKNYVAYVTALTATGNNAPTAPVANDFPK